MSTFTPNKNIEKPANGADVDTWDVNVNADWDIIDKAFGSITTFNVVAASGTITLTSTQYTPPFFVFSGLLTANVNYQLPTGVGGYWWIFNNTTGAFTVTFSSAGGGTTALIPQGSRVQCICDGTNIVFGSAAAGANADITSLKGLGITGLVKGTGSGNALVPATPGTDYVAPGTATNFTATQTFSGTAANIAEILVNAAETGTVSATAATGTIAYYLSSQSFLYFTSNASANWTTNLSFASTPTTLNTVMSVGQIMTCVFAVTQGATAFFNNVVQVDGATSGVTTIWQGGAPTGGNINGVDIYSYAILKTASATFTVFASQVQFR
jgi:hypothetical protein